MPQNRVGISDIALYVPTPKISLDTLLEYRLNQDPSLERRLRRAIDSTGQKAVRYPELWEDNTTLTAQATHNLVTRSGNDNLGGVRYFAVGTETAIDHSKPVAAYAEGMLQRAGIPLPESISTFQVQHACAGGTVSILGVGALLAMSGREGESGIVVSSDIARYEAPSTAEITQGAGAAAMLVETNPRLLELDIGTQGYASRDVDDFFRPLGSVTARVKGGYSVQCYNDAFEAAFLDHCGRIGEAPRDVIFATDLFVVHVPFYKMAVMALHKLLGKFTDLQGDALEEFMAERGFLSSLEASAQIGNIYSGSAYLALASLLSERYETFGDSIVGKRLLLASYGSGNTMIVVSGRVAERAPEVIGGWNLPELTSGGEERSIEHYERWLGAPYGRETYRDLLSREEIPANRFYLAGIREDDYREYQFS